MTSDLIAIILFVLCIIGIGILILGGFTLLVWFLTKVIKLAWTGVW